MEVKDSQEEILKQISAARIAVTENSGGNRFNESVVALNNILGNLRNSFKDLMFITENCYSIPIKISEFDSKINSYKSKNLDTPAFKRQIAIWDRYRSLIVNIQSKDISAAAWVQMIRSSFPGIVYVYQKDFWTLTTLSTKYQRGTYAVMTQEARNKILTDMFKMTERSKELIIKIDYVMISKIYQKREDMIKHAEKISYDDLDMACTKLMSLDHTIVEMKMKDTSRKYINMTHMEAASIMSDENSDDEKSLAAIIKVLGIPNPSKLIMNKFNPDDYMSNLMLMYINIVDYFGGNVIDIKNKVANTPANHDRAKTFNQIFAGYVKMYNWMLGQLRRDYFGDTNANSGPIKEYKAAPIVIPNKFIDLNSSSSSSSQSH